MTKPGINEFHDVNMFPKEPGIFYYAVSMPLLTSKQSPQEFQKVEEHLLKKIQVSNVGAQVVYTDSLYLYSEEPAMDLKTKHQKLIEEHKRGWMNFIRQNINIIPRAFTFMTWSQLLLDCPNFSSYLVQFRKMYEDDQQLQAYVDADIEKSGREVSKHTVGYMLEEILADYLVTKGRVRLQNDYTLDREEWILNCYHGKPHRAYVYLHQKNFFDLHNKRNVYENSWYDLTAHRLYDFARLDIETFDFGKKD